MSYSINEINNHRPKNQTRWGQTRIDLIVSTVGISLALIASNVDAQSLWHRNLVPRIPYTPSANQNYPQTTDQTRWYDSLTQLLDARKSYSLWFIQKQYWEYLKKSNQELTQINSAFVEYLQKVDALQKRVDFVSLLEQMLVLWANLWLKDEHTTILIQAYAFLDYLPNTTSSPDWSEISSLTMRDILVSWHTHIELWGRIRSVITQGKKAKLSKKEVIKGLTK